MAKRRKRLKKGLKGAAGSLAGTLGEAGQQLKERVKNERARRRLESYRSDEVKDQGRARLERAKAKARKEAMKEARQEFQKEYREDLKDNIKEEQLLELRRRYGQLDDEQQARSDPMGGPSMGTYDPEERLGELFGGGPSTTHNLNKDDERGADILSGFGFGTTTGTTLVGVDANDNGKFERDEITVFPRQSTGAGLPGGVNKNDDDSEAYDPERRLGELFGP